MADCAGRIQDLARLSPLGLEGPRTPGSVAALFLVAKKSRPCGEQRTGRSYTRSFEQIPIVKALSSLPELFDRFCSQMDRDRAARHEARRPYLRERLSSFDKAFRKSASARLPAKRAALSD
jgi:hypothetical protein